MNLLFVKSLNKIFSFDSCLGADCPERRAFYPGVIRNGHRGNGCIRVFSLEKIGDSDYLDLASYGRLQPKGWVPRRGW